MIVSIILPIRNEQKFIGKTLDSILAQNFIGDLEIIIADGMSDDGTLEIIQKYQEKNKDIKIVKNFDRVVPIGFNKALTISRGNIIIRVDGHATISSGFIANCVSLIQSKNVECVGGPIKHQSNTMIGDYVSIAQASKFGAGGASFRTDIKNGQFVNTLAFGAYKRDTFNQIGGYDEELVRNQDEELNYRLIQNGGKIWIDPSIKSLYYVRSSIFKLFIQYFYYGFYKVRVIQKIKSIFSLRHLIPAIFVLILNTLLAFAIFQNKLFPIYTYGGIYLLASIVFSVYESIKHHSKSLILLPIIYFIMHFSYGLGFLLGLFYFMNRWGDDILKDNHFERKLFKSNSNGK
tara:strand:- start:340 stop:1380 length:1041 start_codon:yes stop_codon:yes gene_type:complete